MRKYSQYQQGIYTPINKNKFLTPKPFYRSSWERKFMWWADNNPNVLQVGCENIIIPYISPIDHRAHRYYVDNFIVIREGDKVKKYLVEIKPSTQTVAPKTSKRKKESTILHEKIFWEINQAKWAAAKEFAKARGAEFILITEKQLFNE